MTPRIAANLAGEKLPYREDIGDEALGSVRVDDGEPRSFGLAQKGMAIMAEAPTNIIRRWERQKTPYRSKRRKPSRFRRQREEICLNNCPGGTLLHRRHAPLGRIPKTPHKSQRSGCQSQSSTFSRLPATATRARRRRIALLIQRGERKPASQRQFNISGVHKVSRKRSANSRLTSQARESVQVSTPISRNPRSVSAS